jgi:hypothetical protein
MRFFPPQLRRSSALIVAVLTLASTLYSSVANDTAYSGTYRNGTLTFSDLGIVSVFVRQ